MSQTRRTKEAKADCHGGFTLIELLVVIAVISVLTAVLLPVLGKVRQLGRRTACQGRLKQITLAWFMYFDDHDGKTFQGRNADVAFAGWAGLALPLDLPRPLNPYLSLPLVCKSESQAEIVKCPADTGRGERYKMPIYASHGSSYRTNIWLVGPNQTNAMDRNPALTQAVNSRLRNLNIRKTDNPSRLLLVGDHHWGDQWWDPPGEDADAAREEVKKKEWHGVPQSFNMTFVDGHVAFVKIPQGQYHAEEYTVIPWRDLYRLVD